MTAWAGRMSVSFLNDKQVHAIEYHRWADAKRRFERRGKDRKTVDEYKAKIQAGKKVEPIHLGVSDRWFDVYVRDGHHRAVAYMELGASEFPFVWSWIQYSGGTKPLREPFPYGKANL